MSESRKLPQAINTGVKNGRVQTSKPREPYFDNNYDLSFGAMTVRND